MREVPVSFDTIWRAGDFTGQNRAFRRVTVRRPMMRLDSYDMVSTFRRVPVVYGDVASSSPYPSGIDPTRGDPCTNVYADYFWTPPEQPKEVPNVASISWSRDVDTDTAQVTVEFWNTAAVPIGDVPGALRDEQGYLSPYRGLSPLSPMWNHVVNEWAKMLMPDNVICTYEGWGSDSDGIGIGEDGYVPPERDSRLVQTGLWIIDEVKLDARGRIVVVARDPGRLLLDHQGLVPVVPEDFYPLTFRDWGDRVTVRSNRTVVTQRAGRLPGGHGGSGNDLWPESAYTGAKVYGHSSLNAFDGNPNSYWLSVGNPKVGYRSSYEYLDITLPGSYVSELRFSTVKSGYNAYVSVKRGGAWVPGTPMPYHRDGRGRYEEGVPYIASVGGLQGEGEHVIRFGPIDGVTVVRLWLGNLQDFGLPGSKYRAGVREVSVYGPERLGTQLVTDQVALTPGPAGSNPGRCLDYSDCVKLMLAWAGLYWPEDAFVYHCDGEVRYVSPAVSDGAVLGAPVRGRVWGDIQQTGTAPVGEMVASIFDKKSLMDGVRYIAEALGFMIFFDETGAAQWRLPNVWTRGNWVTGLAQNPGRTSRVITVDDRQVLLDMESTMQSRSVREGVFVANPTGAYAVLVPGFNPNPTGLRRVGGYSDARFASQEEARVMADLIAVRQMFRYHTASFRIPANPAIQIDDQIRLVERVTAQGWYHYVQSITSTNNAETGQWTYDIGSHWLGDDPNGAWAFDRSTLDSTTLAYVDALGRGPETSRAGLEV